MTKLSRFTEKWYIRLTHAWAEKYGFLEKYEGEPPTIISDKWKLPVHRSLQQGVFICKGHPLLHTHHLRETDLRVHYFEVRPLTETTLWHGSDANTFYAGSVARVREVTRRSPEFFASTLKEVALSEKFDYRIHFAAVDLLGKKKAYKELAIIAREYGHLAATRAMELLPSTKSELYVPIVKYSPFWEIRLEAISKLDPTRDEMHLLDIAGSISETSQCPLIKMEIAKKIDGEKHAELLIDIALNSRYAGVHDNVLLQLPSPHKERLLQLLAQRSLPQANIAA